MEETPTRKRASANRGESVGLRAGAEASQAAAGRAGAAPSPRARGISTRADLGEGSRWVPRTL